MSPSTPYRPTAPAVAPLPARVSRDLRPVCAGCYGRMDRLRTPGAWVCVACPFGRGQAADAAVVREVARARRLWALALAATCGAGLVGVVAGLLR